MRVPTVLVLPFPAQGHVNPMAILSQKLVEHGCRVIFVNTDFNHTRVVSSMAKQQHSIDESQIKLVSVPDGLEPDDDRHDFVKVCEATISTMPTSLEKLIEDIHGKGEDRISFIVADFCMAWAMDVAAKLGIKGAIFWPASAAVFATMYNIPKLIDDGVINSDGSMLTTTKTIQLSPGMLEMDAGALFWLKMGDTVNFKPIFDYMVRCVQSLNLAEEWLCDTTYELEPRVLTYFPKILSIGPLLRSYDNTNATSRSLGQFWEEDLSCMKWLDQQPHDLTNRPFLWVVRQDNKLTYPSEFQGHKGKIVAWAPQQKVLNHPAISCFITHCGWNSTMEGLSNGVPFLCWPYFAEQIYNKSYICDELKVRLELKPNENKLVSQWEIKKKLNQLLSDEQMRARSLELKEIVVKNVSDQGSGSSNNIRRFVKWLKS
uniref:Cytokinin-O-glucosyltransferase 2 n=1 Tax=Cajanus cajan TaxID=3821 RepID=A0A151RG90_CAJCA|nr:Cytokinin-O-glucosyltransferase 2 [Cajanus cajan]